VNICPPQGPCPWPGFLYPQGQWLRKLWLSKLTVCRSRLTRWCSQSLSAFWARLSQFKVIAKQLESTLAPDLRNFEPPIAQVYVGDAHAARQATGALLTNILERHVDARLIVVGGCDQRSQLLLASPPRREGHPHLRGSPRTSFLALCRWYRREASGCRGSVLSGFVDSILTSQGRRLKTDSVTNLSRREQEVLDSLLENLSNKEIASKLNIAERTVKFHVSNLLNKFGVRREQT